jgi:hypothetical protein|tara:strand:+ start:89 stop:637 length:549 start_codon:yes stop_codon:yes gene_type:complete
MAKYTMDMILEYAKVFPENADMGSPDGPRAAQAVHQSGGQFITNAYFTEEAQIGHLEKEGLDLHPMNSDRIRQGNADLGIGKYMKVKRKVSDVKNFTDRNGEPVTIDYGGAPTVVNLTEGRENKRLWNFSEDGPLGNGTKAKVQFEVYANGAGVRLLNVGVTDHVPYESNNAVSEDDELFIV